MIKPRPVLERTNNQQQFIERAEANDLSVLSLEQLVERYNQIDTQSQLFKGLILLEARDRFKSDKEFGQWISSVELFNSSRYSNANYMNLARFFKNKDMTGISITAAYEISAPSNSDIADEIYSYALLKNLSVNEVKQQIALKKGTIQTILKSETITSIDTEIAQIDDEIADKSIKNEITNIENDLKSQLMAVAKTVSPQVAIVALQACIQELNQLRYPIK